MTATHRNTADLEATGRQVGYWIDRGWLRPTSRGVGNSYQWTSTEWRVAVVMARLARAGLSPEAAHRVARGAAEIGPGLVVLVDQPVGVAS
jgi:small-conductance mechanosensitive channel